MRKLRWTALGLAVLSVGLLATPAAAAKTVVKVQGKDLSAVLTDCPANSAPGTRCAAWIVFASKVKVRTDGTIDRFGFLGVDKYRIRITDSGFVACFAATGSGTPSSLQISDNLSRGSVSGRVDVTYFETCDDPGSGVSRQKTISVAVALRANAPADFQKGRVVTKIDDCRIVDRFNFRTRTADGTATMNGISFATTDLGPFLSSVSTSESTTIARGNCNFAGSV